MIRRALFLLLALCPLLHAERPNVLFIAIDDQNDWIGYLGTHPQVKTPNIDKLAARGTAFMNAHTQAPLCNPSRSSLLTGLRPGSTGIYGLAPGIREVEQLKNHITLPQTFTQAGYATSTHGKIYHDGSIRPRDQKAEFNDWGSKGGGTKPPEKIAKLPPQLNHPAMDWGIWPPTDEETPDWKIASSAVAALEKAPSDKPFFVACGFRLPHVPCYAPQKWFDLYPDNTLVMPLVKEDDRDDLPKFADFLHWRLPEPRLKTLRATNEWRPLVRAYLSCTSFMDSQVGRVLDALEKTGRADNTIVVLWSDHGWHLGEKLITGKNTLWERSTHVPLVFAGPGVTKGAKCQRTVELLDIFPTLLALCHMPERTDLEGHSLVPQLTDASSPRPWPAITQHNQGNFAVRTEDWRYIRYADHSEELYDKKADPNEWYNLAKNSKYDAKKTELAKWIPKADKPPVPGSKERILTYEPLTGEAIWEDKVIDKTAPLPEF